VNSLNCSLLARGKISTTNNRVYNLSPFMTTLRQSHEINSPSWSSVPEALLGICVGCKKLSWGRQLCCLRRYIMSRKIGRPVRFSGKFQNTRQRIQAFFYWSWRVFEIKPHPPFFLSMKVQKKMQFFIPLKFPSAVARQL